MNWSSANHRHGFRKCTSVGYALSIIAYFFFLLSLVGLFACAGVIAETLLKGDYTHSDLIVILVPISSFIVHRILNAVALGIAKRKGFKYDYKKDECTWNQP